MANIAKLKVNGTTYGITAKKVSGTYSGNGGQQGPGYFGTLHAGFLMSNAKVNSDTNYKNWLYMDNYPGNDAGGATAFGVSRVAPRAFLMQSDAKRSSWNNYAELLSTYNYNTYAPKKDGTGASGTWGINISGKANTAGTADTSKACSGNSATATKATQDSAGQQINTTYIKGLSVSGATLTITKGNGTTSTATINQTAGMLPSTRVLQGGGTKLYSYNGGLDHGDITLSQAFTNFKYLVVFLSHDNQADDLYVETIETAVLYQAMAGNNTYWPGNRGVSVVERVILGRFPHNWFIYNLKGGSSTTYFKHIDDDNARLFSIYGIN